VDNEAEEEEEEDLIRQLKKAKEKPERKMPPDIKMKQILVDICMHPEENIVALSTVDGEEKPLSIMIILPKNELYFYMSKCG